MSRIVRHPAAYRPAFTSQPQIPVEVDWNNPITKGLVSVFNGAANTYGLSSSYNSSGKYAIPISTKVNITPILQESSGSSSTQTLISVMVGQSGSGNFGVGMCDSIRYRKSSSTVGQLFLTTVAGGDNYSGTFAIPTTPFVLILQTNFGGFGYRSYVNGVAAVSASYLGVPKLSTLTLQLGGTEFGNGGGTQVNLACAYNRELSAQEIKSISDNPWQIFKKPSLMHTPWVSS